jgi:TusE/DsrC/DsvC family sulfur relay protein
MTAIEIAGMELRRDSEGFLVDPREWTPEIALEIARECGIPELTPRHWQVVEGMRARYLETGAATSFRALDKECGVPIRDLYELFPRGPAKLAAKIGGIPKPGGCVFEERAMAESLAGSDARHAPPVEPPTRVAILASKGALEGIYPALLLASGARMEGIDADLFFTFFGLDAIRKDRQHKILVATVGNPGMHVPTLVGAIPGMSWLATKLIAGKLEELDIPPVGELLGFIHESGGGIYACRASVELFDLEEGDLVQQVDGILTVGEFYHRVAGAHLIYT